MKFYMPIFALICFVVLPVLAQDNPALPEFETAYVFQVPPGSGRIIWSPAGRYITVHVAQTAENPDPHPVQVFDTAAGEFLYQVAEVGDISPDDRYSIVSHYDETGRFMVLDMATGKTVLETAPPGERPYARWNGGWLSAGSSAGVQLYDAATLELRYTFPDIIAEPYGWNPAGTQFMSIADYSAPATTYIYGMDGSRSAPIYNVTRDFAAWSPDGQSVALAIDYARVGIYEGHTGEAVQTLRTENIDYPLMPYFWHESGRWLLVSSGDVRIGTIRFHVFDVSAGREVFSVPMTDYTDERSFEGDTLKVIGTQGTTYYDVNTGEIVREEAGCAGVFQRRSPVLGENLAILYSQEDTSEIRIGNSCTDDVLITLKGHTGTVREAMWSPDGSMIASVADDSTLRIWRRKS